MNTFIM
jgi:hypothetical protein